MKKVNPNVKNSVYKSKNCDCIFSYDSRYQGTVRKKSCGRSFHDSGIWYYVPREIFLEQVKKKYFV